MMLSLLLQITLKYQSHIGNIISIVLFTTVAHLGFQLVTGAMP